MVDPPAGRINGCVDDLWLATIKRLPVSAHHWLVRSAVFLGGSRRGAKRRAHQRANLNCWRAPKGERESWSGLQAPRTQDASDARPRRSSGFSSARESRATGGQVGAKTAVHPPAGPALLAQPCGRLPGRRSERRMRRTRRASIRGTASCLNSSEKERRDLVFFGFVRPSDGPSFSLENKELDCPQKAKQLTMPNPGYDHDFGAQGWVTNMKPAPRLSMWVVPTFSIGRR